MSFVGGGWRSGSAADVAGGSNSTATVSTLSPSTAARSAGLQTVTVTGTGFVAGSVIHVNYAPVPTTFLSATQVRTPALNPMTDNGAAGAIPVGVRNPGEKMSGTQNFAAT